MAFDRPSEGCGRFAQKITEGGHYCVSVSSAASCVSEAKRRVSKAQRSVALRSVKSYRGGVGGVSEAERSVVLVVVSGRKW